MGLPQVHAKLFVVDDGTFYIGSQNLYANNLAEWGQIVDAVVPTQELLASLWEPLWRASVGAATSGSGTRCDIDIPWTPLLVSEPDSSDLTSRGSQL
mmetsp:Transcript_51991/g.103470  ORF Transcript_51991/g.103470 Transcript_51991/m.103470 type:complete len:97 (+) Transcript_51991:116-406(+)